MSDERQWFPTDDPRRRGSASGVILVLVVVVAVVVAIALLRRGGVREVQVTGDAAPTPGAPSQSSGGAREPAAGTAGIAGDFEGCPVSGDGGDRELNTLKNRSFEGPYQPADVDSLVALPWPAEIGGRPRSRWSGRARAHVAPQERRAVSVEGYLAKARASGPEATNCHGDEPRFRDYHLWLTSAPGAGREQSLIAEMTPRVRAVHPNWNLEVLDRVVSARERVRVSGWILLDQEHPDQIGKTRGTVWEVHPVTRFEVLRGGQWISLDDVSLARRVRGARR